MAETGDFPIDQLPTWLRQHMEQLIRLAQDRRIRYLGIVYGVEDRKTIESYMSMFSRADLRGAIGRSLLRAACVMLGAQTASLVPVVEAEPPPKSTVLH